MPNFWDRVRALDGSMLETSIQAKKFVITGVTPDRVNFAPKEGNTAKRWFLKRDLEDLNELFCETPEVTPAMVREKFPKNQNTSYVAAILMAVKEVD